jgi:hypothetical protein
MPRFSRIKVAATKLRPIFVALFLCFAVFCDSRRTEAQLAPTNFGRHLAEAVSSSRLVGRVPREQEFTLALGLPLRNQAELDTLLAALVNPESPSYRQYLTPQQFAARFGPTDEDYQAVIQFAQEHNLTVRQTHSNHGVLTVTGTAADVEQAFNVHVNVYEHPARGQFFAADREPALPAGLAIQDVSGLDNFTPPQPMNLTQQPLTATANVSGSGPGGYLIGNDFRSAYAPAVTLTGSGQAVGLLEFDGFFAGDVTRNFAAAKLPAVPVQTVLLDGISGSAGSSNVEVILDIMMSAYMAPGVTKVIVYEGNLPNDILNRMATDNLAAQLSSSWGFGINATTEQIYKQFAAQGQAMLQASGDSGAYTNGVMAPSDDPALTVVGGTSLVTAGAGGPWQSETAWSGSGGGVSTVYPIPAWQQSVTALPTKGGSTTMRNIPDVAMTADIEMYLICNNGQAISVGGTSAAAPLWAGFLALANQQAAAKSKPRIGFLNPLLYAIGESGSFNADLNDITVGSNGKFKALAGYDLTTGWGSPSGQHLINDLTGVAGTPSFTIATSVASLTAHPSSSASATIVITDQNGFASPVTLALSGLPAGVSSTFGATSASSTSVPLTFNISSTAAAGTYPLTITGTSGRLTSTAPLTLSITIPAFTLAPANASLTVNRPASVTTGLVVTAINGFTGAVNYSAANLPAGVSAAFTSATSVSPAVTFTATTTAAAGTYPITIKGVSGTLSASTIISLTVTAPSFSISAMPASLALPRGTTAHGSILLTPLGGFNSAVTLTASGLPAGVTFTAAAFSSTESSALTFTATAAAVSGSYSITINGGSGSLTAATKVTLTVPAAATGDTFVNLSSAYNVNALDQDNLPFTGVGLDGGLNGSATAYSATLVGVNQTVGGSSFFFGPANQLDAVSGQTVALPTGNFTSLKLLATGVNGAQFEQAFRVTYTDGTSTTINQSVSDWFTPSRFAGETTAMTMLHRVNGAGQIDNRTFYLYEYSLPLNSAKTVLSVTFPANRNVVVLAATLASTSAAVR